MDVLIEQRVQSFEEIVEREHKVVRHIRFLAPLALLSPRIVDAIANGNVASGVTVSGLVRSLSVGATKRRQQSARQHATGSRLIWTLWKRPSIWKSKSWRMKMLVARVIQSDGVLRINFGCDSLSA